MALHMPVLMPVTTPVDGLTDTSVQPVLHVPPAGVQDNAVVPPMQTVAVPVMGPGTGLTVIAVVV